MTVPSLFACPECDLLHRVRPLGRGETAFCARCGGRVRRGGGVSRDVTLALYLVALLLLLLAHASPLLALRLHGSVQEASLPGCARILAQQGWPWLSAILITTVILAPLAHFAGVCFVLGVTRTGRQTRLTGVVFRLVGQFRAWEMAEVFVLGILVSYVKLSQMATVVPGPSLWALGAFVLVAAAAVSSLDVEALWAALGPAPPPAPLPPGARTAREASLVACPTCARLAPSRPHASCPRCGTSLHSRKPSSRSRTWALLLTAALLYVPANALPVMRIVSMGRVQSDTILGGILYFLRTGSWYLAALIFVASILVPIVKLLALTGLLLFETRPGPWSPRQRALVYRVTEAIGRWSMVDIFVVTLMVAMVEMGNVASASPGPGAMAFAMMVVTTMLAVHFFDPRLVWDAQAKEPPAWNDQAKEPLHG